MPNNASTHCESVGTSNCRETNPHPHPDRPPPSAGRRPGDEDHHRRRGAVYAAVRAGSVRHACAVHRVPADIDECGPGDPQAIAGPRRPNGTDGGQLVRFSLDELRSVGLSPQKAAYVADLSAKVNDGTVDLRRLGRLPDERVVEQLTQVKGIGRWTAQMFLIFSLGRPDVFPHDDLGVRTAVRDRYGLAELPDKATSHANAAPPGARGPRWPVGIVGDHWTWPGKR